MSTEIVLEFLGGSAIGAAYWVLSANLLNKKFEGKTLPIVLAVMGFIAVGIFFVAQGFENAQSGLICGAVLTGWYREIKADKKKKRNSYIER